MKIVYSGRLIYGKGVADLVRAVKLLALNDVQCVIVGDGPERQYLKDLAGPNIEFVGEKPLGEAIKILKSGDIFVNPSYTEGLPTAVIEAALCGKAIVATNVGGTPEIVQHEVSALLVSPRNVPKLVEAIRRLIDDAALRSRLGRAALADNKDRWQWAKSAEQYEKLFRQLA